MGVMECRGFHAKGLGGIPPQLLSSDALKCISETVKNYM